MDEVPQDVYSYILEILPISEINALGQISSTLANKTAEVRKSNLYWKHRLEDQYDVKIDYTPVKSTWNEIYNSVIKAGLDLKGNHVRFGTANIDVVTVLYIIGYLNQKNVNYIFSQAAMRGNLDVVKFLFSLGC